MSINKEGYLTIEGRAKRFAKIAGEMVSLTYVENYLDRLWPEDLHAVVSMPDEKKGEQLVLLTTRVDANKSDIIPYARQQGISELWVPKIIHVLSKLPLLGSGKVDYTAIKLMLKED